jgi:hypothetical protein
MARPLVNGQLIFYRKLWHMAKKHLNLKDKLGQPEGLANPDKNPVAKE